jgi:nucleoside-diphosphate-sugar epimerase
MLPQAITSEDQLDELLTRPSPALVEFIKTIPSPLVLLGASGKMGPTLAVRAHRAARQAGHPLEIVAASRFSNSAARRWLEDRGVSTIPVDILNSESLKGLPQAACIIYLAGQKFGTSENPAYTWAINTLAPANVCRRYPTSRIVALSTGSVYPFTPVSFGGAKETHPLTPTGEYANACVARERIFEYFSQVHNTPVALIRLFYAVELRYGVLVDIAEKVYYQKPVDLSMGYLNWIWQGDANDMILRSLALAHTPPQAYNLSGPQIHSVRTLAEQFGEVMGKTVNFTGSEAATALLGNCEPICALLGNPETPMDVLIRWTADWIQRQGRLLGKPTHFEVRDGRY